MREGYAVRKALLRCEYFAASNLRVYCVIGFIPSMFCDIHLVWHVRLCFVSVPVGLVIFGSCRVRTVSVRTCCLVLNVQSNISTCTTYSIEDEIQWIRITTGKNENSIRNIPVFKWRILTVSNKLIVSQKASLVYLEAWNTCRKYRMWDVMIKKEQ